jgi:hypothetical protein
VRNRQKNTTPRKKPYDPDWHILQRKEHGEARAGAMVCEWVARVTAGEPASFSSFGWPCGQVCEEESALKYASLFGYFLGAKK